MVMSSKSVVFALLFASVDGARVARKRVSEDCYSPLDGKLLTTLNVCAAAEVLEVEELVAARQCTLLSDERAFQSAALGQCTLVSIACDAQFADVLKAKQLNATLESMDAGRFYRKMSGTAKSFVEDSTSGVLSSDFYTAWRDLETIMARVEAAVQDSAGAAQLETIGTSVEGRDLKAVRLRGDGWSPGMPRLVLTFTVHAREWIVAMAGTYAVEKIVEKAKNDRSWLAGKEVVLVPMVNPDGFKHSHGFWRFHRKNMKVVDGILCTTGVDLNRNSGSSWGKFGASSRCAAETFRGESKLSEPEAQTLDRLFREAPMTAYFDVHSYGQYLLSDNSWTTDPHPRAAEFREFGSKIHFAMEARHGQTIKFGPSAQTLYVASGVLQDAATELGALGYTFELRPSGFQHLLGFTPNVREILPAAEECFAGILAGIANLDSV